MAVVVDDTNHALTAFTLDPKDCFEREPGFHVTVGLEPIGIKEASTYPLFCAAHDNVYFQDFDNAGTSLNAKTAGKAAFRAAALEAHKKSTKKYSPAGIVEMLTPEVTLDVGAYRRMGAWAVGKSAADDFMVKFEACVTSDDWSCLSHVVVEVEGAPAVLACGAVSSEVTPDGSVHYDSADFTQKGGYVFLNSRATEQSTQYVFSHFHGDHNAKRLSKWLMRQRAPELIRVLPYLLADLTEDVFIRPDWFWSLNEFDRERFGQRLQLFRVLGFQNDRTITPWKSAKVSKIRAG